MTAELINVNIRDKYYENKFKILNFQILYFFINTRVSFYIFIVFFVNSYTMNSKSKLKRNDKNWTRTDKRITKILNDNEIENQIEDNDDMFEALELRNDG